MIEKILNDDKNIGKVIYSSAKKKWMTFGFELTLKLVYCFWIFLSVENSRFLVNWFSKKSHTKSEGSSGPKGLASKDSEQETFLLKQWILNKPISGHQNNAAISSADGHLNLSCF